MKEVRPAKPAAHRFCILANPASGSQPRNQRYALLKRAAAILGAEVHGLDTASADQFAQCARERAERWENLVVAGGDGTFSLVLNAVDLPAVTLAFLPFGTGNALTHALSYRGGIESISARIAAGHSHSCDLIDCDGRRKAFMVSLGLDGCAIELYEAYKRRGYRGLNAHLRAGLRAAFKEFRPTGGKIVVDGEARRVKKLHSLMVVKQPYFGMGLKVVPGARWGDGYLHSRAISSGLAGISGGLLTGFTIGNRAGEYRRGKQLTALLDAPLPLQVDGEVGWTSDRFTFRSLPGILRMRY